MKSRKKRDLKAALQVSFFLILSVGKPSNLHSNNMWLGKHIEIHRHLKKVKDYSAYKRMCDVIYLCAIFLYQQTYDCNTKCISQYGIYCPQNSNQYPFTDIIYTKKSQKGNKCYYFNNSGAFQINSQGYSTGSCCNKQNPIFEICDICTGQIAHDP